VPPIFQITLDIPFRTGIIAPRCLKNRSAQRARKKKKSQSNLEHFLDHLRSKPARANRLENEIPYPAERHMPTGRHLEKMSDNFRETLDNDEKGMYTGDLA